MTALGLIAMILATALTVIAQYADVSTTNHPSPGASEANGTGFPQFCMKHFGWWWWVPVKAMPFSVLIGGAWYGALLGGGLWPYAFAAILTVVGALAFVPAIVENMRLNGQIAQDAYPWIPHSFP